MDIVKFMNSKNSKTFYSHNFKLTYKENLINMFLCQILVFTIQ